MKKRTTKFIPPTLEEVQEFVIAHNYSVNPETFFNYYEMCGWKVGAKKSMKSWEAAIRYWQSNTKPLNKEITEGKMTYETTSF